jgi:hypothetical protein
MRMLIFTVGLIMMSVLVMSSMVLTPPTTLLASGKGLKLYLTIDTNLNDDVIIYTYQYEDRVFTHDAVIHSGSNEVTLQYPSGLIDTGEFRICVKAMDYDELACNTGYNSEAKQPEHVFINLFEENRNSPNVDVDDSQAQSQNQDNEQSQSQSQNNNQEQTTTIINCPPDSRCVVEQ